MGEAEFFRPSKPNFRLCLIGTHGLFSISGEHGAARGWAGDLGKVLKALGILFCRARHSRDRIGVGPALVRRD